MDFSLMSCPYCGRAVDSGNSAKYVCTECGKGIHTNRTDVRSFFPDKKFSVILDAAEEGFYQKALPLAEELCTDEDVASLFLRGYVYALMGEDGKAATDWKKALNIAGDSTELDSYVCLMCLGISRMILYKEKEFIEFSKIPYIDKLCDEIDNSTGLSCKAFVYYTVYRDCAELGENDVATEVVPELFRRVVEYHRNYWCLPRIIGEYLVYRNYSETTFEEDNNTILHAYNMIRKELLSNISGMTEEDRLRILDHWNDGLLKETIEPALDSMLKKKGFLSKLLSKESAEDKDVGETIRQYVNLCLLKSQ